MRKLICIIIVCALAISASAQTNFIDNLTRKVEGQGIVTITQDKRLTDIINGVGRQAVPSTDGNKEKEQQNVAEDDEDELTPGTATGKKTKVKGFRIQIYWGGSQRIHQTKAQQAAEKVATLFPDIPVYTSFESPHWRCRVGDFTNRHKAWEALQKLREAGVVTDAMIVPSEIYIYQ